MAGPYPHAHRASPRSVGNRTDTGFGIGNSRSNFDGRSFERPAQSAFFLIASNPDSRRIRPPPHLVGDRSIRRIVYSYATTSSNAKPSLIICSQRLPLPLLPWARSARAKATLHSSSHCAQIFTRISRNILNCATRWRKQQEYIGPMTTDELRRAIEEPAQTRTLGIRAGAGGFDFARCGR